jgi:hypothetical protein
MSQPQDSDPGSTSAREAEAARLAAEQDGVSAPGSDERRDYLAQAVADVNAGVAAETYDTDGENTEA